MTSSKIWAMHGHVGSMRLNFVHLSQCLPSDAWIPRGGLYDIYAVGVQECLIPDQLCKAIHFFIGPSQYTYFTESIGSGTTTLGFHGFIQLMVFVR